MNFINLSTSYFYYLYNRNFFDLNTRNILALGYGLAGAAVYIVLQSYIYFFDPKLAVNLWFGWALYAMIVLFPSFAAYHYRKLIRYISFKEAFATFFIAVLAISTILFVYNAIVLNFIYSEEQLTLLKNIQKDFNLSIMEQSNQSIANVEASRKSFEKMDISSVTGLFKQYLQGLLPLSIIGMLLSLLLKNKATA